MAISWMILTFWNVRRHVLSSSAIKWNASDHIKVGRSRSTKWILHVDSHPLSNAFLPFYTLFLLSFRTHLKSADYEIYLLLETQYTMFLLLWSSVITYYFSLWSILFWRFLFRVAPLLRLDIHCDVYTQNEYNLLVLTKFVYHSLCYLQFLIHIYVLKNVSDKEINEHVIS